VERLETLVPTAVAAPPFGAGTGNETYTVSATGIENPLPPLGCYAWATLTASEAVGDRATTSERRRP
jgi:hypothetical protein